VTALDLRTTVAAIIEELTTDGHTIAVKVKCPWCNGTHQHAWNTGMEFAYPHCGTPGVGYWMQWPTHTAEETS
jgi:hypothetical protein